MEVHHYFNIILPMLLMFNCVREETVIENMFKFYPGKNFTGRKGREFMAEFVGKCSLR